MIEFKAVPLASLLNLRNQYLDSLRYPRSYTASGLLQKALVSVSNRMKKEWGISFSRKKES